MAFLWASACSVARAAGAEYAAMIMLDGFRQDYAAMYNLPNLRALTDAGAWVAEARGVFPHNTTPNQYSFVTGALPVATRVPNNRYYDRVTDSMVGAPRDVGVPTIVDAVRAAGKTAAVVNHFAVLGTANINAGPDAGPEAAAEIVMRSKPTLLVYYYPWTDSIGHKYGPYSVEMRSEAVKADAAVGLIVGAYRAAGIYDKTIFIIASDHSMSSNAAPAIPVSVPQALRAAGFNLFDATSSDSIPPGTEVVLVQIGSSFIYLREPSRAQGRGELPPAPSPENYLRLLRALAPLQNATVYDRPQLWALGCDPGLLGDVVVAPSPGWLMVPSSGKGGLHGRPQEASTLLILTGAGVRAGTVVQRGSIIDVVPTVLASLSLPPLPTCTGVTLSEALW